MNVLMGVCFLTGAAGTPAKRRARGELTQKALEKMILSYANKVGTSGFWLDWLDAVLFTENNDRNLGIIRFSRGPECGLEIIAAHDQLKEIPGLSESVEASHVIERNEDTWLIMSCHAGFNPADVANHWVPCVFKELVPESTYLELTAQKIAQLKVRIAELQSALLDVELEDDLVVQESLTQSIQEEITSQLASEMSEHFFQKPQPTC